MITKAEIKEYAEKLGLSPVGVASPSSFDRVKDILTERSKNGYLSGLEKGSVEERCCPHLHLKGVKSIIAAGLPYSQFGGTVDINTDKGFTGIISGSAAGQDYHRILAEKLHRLASFISSSIKGFEYIVMVDTGPLVDREAAYMAGLGWYGKNCSIISPSFGSAFFLGEMLINVYLEPDPVMEQKCGECKICLEKCPTGALTGPYTLDATKCISYLTQKRGMIPGNLRGKMGVSIYGCDMCQQFCPYNSKVKKGGNREVIVDIKKMLEMDRKEFEEIFNDSAAAWRGLNILKRNAVIALGNIGREEGILLLKKAMRHPSPVIRGHAAWSLGQIGGEKAGQVLRNAMVTEKDGYVVKEMQNAMNQLG